MTLKSGLDNLVHLFEELENISPRVAWQIRPEDVFFNENTFNYDWTPQSNETLLC